MTSYIFVPHRNSSYLVVQRRTTSYLVVSRRTWSYLHTSLTVSECFQSVDRDLLTCGWQETSLIDDTTSIFVYALLRHGLDENTTSVEHLRTLVYLRIYVSYEYVPQRTHEASETKVRLHTYMETCAHVYARLRTYLATSIRPALTSYEH